MGPRDPPYSITDDLEDLLATAARELRAERFDAALDAGRQAAAKAPMDPRPLAMLGHAWLGKGQPPQAIEAWRRAITLDDQNLDLVLLLAEQLAQVGEHDEARSLANFVLLQESLEPAFLQRAQALKTQLPKL